MDEIVKLPPTPFFKLYHPELNPSDTELEQSGSVLVDVSEQLVIAITGEFEQDPAHFHTDIQFINNILNTLIKNTQSIDKYLDKNPSIFISTDPLPDINHEPFAQYLVKSLANYYIYYFSIIKFNIDKLFPNSLSFSWVDTLTQEKHEQKAWAFEKANCLFNMGQLHYLLAKFKYSFNFQFSTNPVLCNAIAAIKPYHHLLHASTIYSFMKINFLHAPTEDMQTYALDAFINLFSSDAQLLMLQNSKSSSLKVKLCNGALQYLLKTTELNLSTSSHLYLQIFANYYKSQHCLELKQYGQSIARLQYALQLAKQYKDPSLIKSLQSLLQLAMKDNDVVYHETIPKIDELLELETISSITIPLPTIDTIKETCNASIMDIVPKTLFHSLIPVAIVEQASIYSNKQSELIRKAEHDSVDSQFEQWLSENHVLMRLQRFSKSTSSTQDTSVLDPLVTRIKQKESDTALQHLINQFSSQKQQTLQFVQQLHQISSDPRFKEALLQITSSISNANSNDALILNRFQELQQFSLYHFVFTNQPLSTYLSSKQPSQSLLIEVNDAQPLVDQCKQFLEHWYQLKKQRSTVIEDLRNTVLLINIESKG